MKWSPRILIVERPEADTTALIEELTRSGYEPTVERVDTLEGLSALLEHPGWDVVVLDEVLLRQSAPVLAAARQKSALPVPILVIVDEAGEAAVAAARRLGASDCISKDNIERMASTIENALCGAGIRRARAPADTTVRAAHEELEARRHEIEQPARASAALSEIGTRLQTCATVEECYAVIAEAAQVLFPSDSGALYLLNGDPDRLQAVAAWGQAAATLSASGLTPDQCWALRRGRLHVMDDPGPGLICAHVERTRQAAPFAGYLCVPLMEQGNPLGILHLHSSARPAPTAGQTGKAEGAGRGLTEAGQRLAMTLAEYIRLALANVKLRMTVRNQVIRDPITGLFNRQYLEETLDRELRRARRNQRPLAVILFQIEQFKRFSGTVGREAADMFLYTLGHYLQVNVRGQDIACHYREDEFLLIMPDAPLDVARQRAEQLREGVRRLSRQQPGQLLERAALSVGVAGFPEHGSTVEALLRAASEHLARPSEIPSRITVGPLTLDCLTFEVILPDHSVFLTPVEFELLYFLMSRAGQVFTAEQLLREVWKYPPGAGRPELVRVHIKNLRGKVEPDPRNPIYIKTVGRFGYTIRAEH